MTTFRFNTTKQIDFALLALRLIGGSIFIAHGAQKLFVYGFAGAAGAFGQMGVPMPGLMGPFISLLEFFGGIALVIGLLTRLASLGLTFNMLGAILLVHLKGGFFLPTGVEFALATMAPVLALTLAGPGRFSLDAVIGRRTTAAEAEPVIARKAA